MAENLHVAWARLLLSGFAAAGVQDVVLSPGSRSTPLALAAAHCGLRVHVVIDERQAGFFALGQARRSGRPSVVVCTSGTAAAHYLPSLLEAREAGVPMVVLTADRPWEAHHVHSAQTTDQLKLFGDAVCGFFALGTPEHHELALAAVARTAAQAVARSLGPLRGGVHVNAPFRKPLEPRPGSPILELACAPPRVLGTEARLDEAATTLLADRLRARSRLLVLAGPSLEHDVRSAHDALKRLLELSGGVCVAESTSGLRDAESLRHGEALIPTLRGPDAPDVIVQLGLPVVATALQNWLSSCDVPRLVVGDVRFTDPWSRAELVLPLSTRAGLEAITAAWSSGSAEPWRRSLRATDERLEQLLARALKDGDLATRGDLGEPLIARTLSRALPPSCAVLVGNSLPVRDLDVFGAPLRGPVLHQRGVAGIDGLLAGAAGIASAHEGPVLLYIGDVSFLHDAGALALLATVRTPLVIVAVNNDGGRIFHELPIAKDSSLSTPLESLFVTPHGQSPARIATGFGVAARRVERVAELERALAEALDAPHATVIEAVVPPSSGTEQRRAWRALTKQALA